MSLKKTREKQCILSPFFGINKTKDLQNKCRQDDEYYLNNLNHTIESAILYCYIITNLMKNNLLLFCLEKYLFQHLIVNKISFINASHS